MLAIPKPVLDALDLVPDTSVDVSVQDGRVIVDPRRRRYTLDELIAACKPRAPRSRADREWLAGRPAGRELL